MGRIRNLKYDPGHANKKQRAYSHLEFLDRVFSIEAARRIVAYEKIKYGKAVTMEIVESPPKNKTEKVKKHAANE